MTKHFEHIKATPNHSARTFTLRKIGTKYRTIKLSREEFASCLHHTQADWRQWLTSNDYYEIKTK